MVVVSGFPVTTYSKSASLIFSFAGGLLAAFGICVFCVLIMKFFEILVKCVLYIERRHDVSGIVSICHLCN